MTEKNIPIERLEGGYSIDHVDEDQQDDLFLTSAGFEQRTLKSTQLLDSDYNADLGIIYVNEEYINDVDNNKTKDHVDKLKNNLSYHCNDVDVIEGSWLDAGKQLHSIREGLQPLKRKEKLNITADVTTFNREALLVCFNMLYSVCDEVTARVLYMSPEEYGSWLSKGHRYVRNIVGFAGMQNSRKPTLLMILSGFEKDRAINTIEEIEPAKVLLGIGKPPNKDTFLDKNKERQQLVLDRQDTDKFTFPPGSISGTQDQLEELISEYYNDYNIIVSPMSTKISTLGAWKAARKSGEIQVTYTIPVEYNLEEYSSGIEYMYSGML